MQRREVPADRQAKADAAGPVTGRFRGGERLEDPLLKLRRHSRPGVRHAHVQVRRVDLGGQGDAALGRPGAGIGEKVQQYLPQTHRVGPDGRQAFGQREPPRDPARRRPFARRPRARRIAARAVSYGIIAAVFAGIVGFVGGRGAGGVAGVAGAGLGGAMLACVMPSFVTKR